VTVRTARGVRERHITRRVLVLLAAALSIMTLYDFSLHLVDLLGVPQYHPLRFATTSDIFYNQFWSTYWGTGFAIALTLTLLLALRARD
jgi:hypothetical protein